MNSVFQKIKVIAASLIAGLAIAASPVQASVAFDDSVSGQITVNWDETFTMTAGSSNLNAGYLFLVVNNVFTTSDGPAWGFMSMTQSVSINGGAASTVGNWGGWQYRGGPEYNYDQLDALFGLITGTLPSFSAGDTLRWIGSQTVSVDSVHRMPDLLPGSPTTTYLANYTGTYSNIVTTTVGAAVPEPGSLALVGLGIAAFGIARRRKQ